MNINLNWLFLIIKEMRLTPIWFFSLLIYVVRRNRTEKIPELFLDFLDHYFIYKVFWCFNFEFLDYAKKKEKIYADEKKFETYFLSKRQEKESKI